MDSKWLASVKKSKRPNFILLFVSRNFRKIELEKLIKEENDRQGKALIFITVKPGVNLTEASHFESKMTQKV